jgi:hypothetical protein
MDGIPKTLHDRLNVWVGFPLVRQGVKLYGVIRRLTMYDRLPDRRS